jgi:hemerythrin superfamily protein
MLSEQEINENLNLIGPNIYDLLRQDHKDVKKLFNQVIDSEKFDEKLYVQIKKALIVHMKGEEKFFYPRLENNPETRQITLESYEEHDVGKQIINDIDMSDRSKGDWMFAKIKVLSEAIDMHVKEEETELFKEAKKVLSHDDEHQIGRLFQQAKMNALNQPNLSF